MKTNIATTQSQSQRLLRCGVPADTADMCYDSGALSLMDYHSALCEEIAVEKLMTLLLRGA